MVIAADESWSVPSSFSVRTAPDSMDKIRTPSKLLVWSWSSDRPPPKRTPILPQIERDRQVVIVDQPGLADVRGNHGQVTGWLERGRIDQLGVVQPDERLRFQPRGHRTAEAGGVPLA